MNAERFLAHYEQIANAPDAIARLRRFVLDLAMRGKLVPQIASDEPASELLKQIAKAKERLLEAGEIKVRNTPERDRKEPVAFNCPPGWVLTNLGVVSLKITDGAHKTPTYVEKGVPFISVKDFSGGKLDLSNTRFIPEVENRVLYQRCDPRRGDILIGRIGTLGKAVLVDTDIEFSLFVSVGLIRFDHQSIDPTFFRSLMNSPFVEAEFNRIKIGGGTHTNKLSLGDLHTVAFPLPPLAEQNRIVAKVDELMGLCDRLEAARESREAARESREAARDRLSAASLARLNAPDPETFQVDARFALGALPALTTRPDQIKQLRQTILNLAVRGNLVPQEAKDEPASELLKRLRRARSELEKSGRIRRERSEAPSHYGGEQGFDLPNTWSWARLTEVGQTQTGTSPSSGNLDLFGNFIPFIKPADLDGNEINYGGPGLSKAGIKHSRLVAPHSILMVCIGATLGKVNINARAVCFNQQINSLTPFLDGLTSFLALALKASDFQALAWSKAGTGTLPIISKGKWEVLPVPLPPLAEQHRIVAKVKTLMALCDQLEVSLTATTRRRLLDTLLAEALAPVDSRELVAAE